MAWKEEKGDVTGVIWEGGGLAQRLSKDKELAEMLLDLGLPNVLVGRPVIVGSGSRGDTAYVVQLNSKLAYVGIQLLPRTVYLTYNGVSLNPLVSTTKDFPSLQQIEVADRIAKHVVELVNLSNT